MRQWKLRVHAESRKFLETSPGPGGRSLDVKVDHQRRDDLDLEDHSSSQAVSENVSENAVDSTMDVKLEYKLVERETLRPQTSEKGKEEDDNERAIKSKIKIITI